MKRLTLRRFTSGLLLIALLLTAAGCFRRAAPHPPAREPVFRVHFMDVGQADAALLQFPDGRTALIDGGDNADGEAVVAYLQQQGVSRIDCLVATHPHADHIGGLATVLEAFPVGAVFAPRVTTNTLTFERFLLAVQAAGLKITETKLGTVLLEGEGFTAAFLAPAGSKYSGLNDYSAVLRVSYREVSFLFTGDAEEEAEEEMLRLPRGSLRADVLKVGHHGSDTSSTEAFLTAVSPRYAVISLGEGNSYGFPALPVLERLEQAGAWVYRTDLLGTVVIESDGTEITIRTGKDGNQ